MIWYFAPDINEFSNTIGLCLTKYIYHLKVGVGMSMEGIEQNPIVYDLMSEMAFQHDKVDVKVTLFFFEGSV